MSQPFDFERLVELCRRTHEETRHSAARAVDRSLVVRNWLFGWYIVEYEQSGADRAEYGAQTIEKLSTALRERIGRGFSVRSLEQFRRFYVQFEETLPQAGTPQTVSAVSAAAQIPQTPSAKSTASGEELSRVLRSASTALLERLSLGWSHYVTLLSVTNPEARRFYEIEAAENAWSVRELKRQLDRSLYERLALSRDKHEVRRLAREGQVVEKASDLIKDPVVLEFLGLEEKPAYSENDLEIAIIDRLQQFLLELGKGFLFEARRGKNLRIRSRAFGGRSRGGEVEGMSEGQAARDARALNDADCENEDGWLFSGPGSAPLNLIEVATAESAAADAE